MSSPFPLTMRTSPPIGAFPRNSTSPKMMLASMSKRLEIVETRASETSFSRYFSLTMHSPGKSLTRGLSSASSA